VPFERVYGSRPYDLICTGHGNCLLLVSKRVIRVLRESGFTGWETYPVAVPGRWGLRLRGIAGLAITGRCGPIDETKSERRSRPPHVPGGEAVEVLVGCYFDAATWDGSDLFLPEGWGAAVVTERVKTALERAGVRNAHFERLSEYERPILFDEERRRWVGADLRGQSLAGEDWSGRDLFHVQLAGADLSGADLSRTQLSISDLQKADLRGARLADAVLNGADLRGARLADADLRGADLNEAKLAGADLRSADLSEGTELHATLTRADLRGANLEGAKLQKADLRGADFREASLSDIDLRDAIYDTTTRWPEGFNPARSGAVQME
jgi:uncharacterized protein YjbI with pentapeptide repeats